MFGVEASILIGSDEGAEESVLDLWLQVRQEGVSNQFNVLEEGKIVLPVTCLLLCGGNGDGIKLGKLQSQVSFCEHKAGGSVDKC